MNTFTIVFLIALIISSSIQFWLAKRHAEHVAAHRSAVPDAFKAKVPLAAHQKAADYTLAKIKLGNIDSALGIVILLLLTLGGGINCAFNYWNTIASSSLLAGVAAIATIFLILTVIEIPTSVYQTFVIEEKFGFNKSTVNQFIKDQFMHLGLGAAIGLPLLH
jgi:STE24 endopeptidase